MTKGSAGDVDAAAELLLAARVPLVHGLAQSTVEAQREAVAIAELLGGAIDGSSTTAAASSAAAFQHVGLVTASLGEVKARADLVAFWACDPTAQHPGFVERFAPATAGRTRIAVDVGDARGPAAAELRVALDEGAEIAALAALRAMIRGRRVETDALGRAGLDGGTLRELLERIRASRYAVLFYDGEPTPARADSMRPWALATLARDANKKNRVRLIAIRGSGNAVGGENVLAWQTGFATAVWFGEGFPQHGPGEWSGEGLLARGEADAALLVGAAAEENLSDAALRRLRAIPVVRVGAGGRVAARVVLPAAPLAETAGAVYRMDGVALRNRPGSPATGATEATVLADLRAALARRAGSSR